MQEFVCFTVFIYQYIQSLVFPEMAEEGGATAPLAPLNTPLTTNADNILLYTKPLTLQIVTLY